MKVSRSTLLLNGDGSPLSIVPLSVLYWHTTIKLLYLDKIVPIHVYDDWWVHSPSTTMQVPSVAMLKDYFHQKREIDFTRKNILYRDDFTCAYCGQQFPAHKLTLDHFLPRSLGGKKIWTNMLTACYECNQIKAHHTYMTPIFYPRKPTYGDLVANRKKHPVMVPDKIWNDYLKWPDHLVQCGVPDDDFNEQRVLDL